jgi:AcrR family transcriptional regulator
MAGRRSNSDARATREAILRRAADIGSVEGLRGITIGRLATDLGMSKAGVLSRWRRTLLRDIRQAVSDGDLPADTDPEQVAFVLESLANGTKGAKQLHGDPDVPQRCLVAMHAALGVPPPARVAQSARS